MTFSAAMCAAHLRRACRRAVAEWVAGSRSVAQPGPLQFGDLVWDVTPVQLVTFAGLGGHRRAAGSPEVARGRRTANHVRPLPDSKMQSINFGDIHQYR